MATTALQLAWAVGKQVFSEPAFLGGKFQILLKARCSMYGLFTYIMWKMATLKGKWLGKYFRPMEHLNLGNCEICNTWCLGNMESCVLSKNHIPGFHRYLRKRKLRVFSVDFFSNQIPTLFVFVVACFIGWQRRTFCCLFFSWIFQRLKCCKHGGKTPSIYALTARSHTFTTQVVSFTPLLVGKVCPKLSHRIHGKWHIYIWYNHKKSTKCR